jgi:hypothetical protein
MPVDAYSDAISDAMAWPLRLDTQVHPDRQSACASWQAGGTLQIILPKRLTATQQQEISQNLQRRAIRKHRKHLKVWQQWGASQPTIDTMLTTTPPSVAEISQWVATINQETLKAPLKKVKLGHARLRQMGQMNCRTREMTLARFVLQGLPVDAFRYLVIHELCHLTHANHSKAFWQLVATHMPDWARQDAILMAHHHCLSLAITHGDLQPVDMSPVDLPPVNLPPAEWPPLREAPKLTQVKPNNTPTLIIPPPPVTQLSLGLLPVSDAPPPDHRLIPDHKPKPDQKSNQKNPPIITTPARHGLKALADKLWADYFGRPDKHDAPMQP